MGDENFGRSFKSGNSIAIRIPAEFGVQAGHSWAIRQEPDGTLVLRKVDEAGDTLRLRDLFGAAPRLKRPDSDERDHEAQW